MQRNGERNGQVGIEWVVTCDMPIMAAGDMLEQFGIDYEMTIISAHKIRCVFEYAKTAASPRHMCFWEDFAFAILLSQSV